MEESSSNSHTNHRLIHIIREFSLQSEAVKRFLEWLIRRTIKVASIISYNDRRWWTH